MQNTGTNTGTEFAKKPSLDEVLARVPERWRSALMDEATNLRDDLKKMLFLREKSSEADQFPIQVHSFRREGYSTYQLKLEGENGSLMDVGTIQFAPLFNGSYLIRRTLLATMQVVTYTDQYDENGIYQGRYHDPSPNLLYVNLTDMEPKCPVVSHLCNILLYEYQQAESGQANSPRIRLIEKVLREVDQESRSKSSRFPELSYRAKPFDLALQQMNLKIAQNEIDPALTFSDKGAVRSNLKNERATILRVKKRVHGVKAVPLRMRLIRSDLAARWLGIQKRPTEKILGTIHKYTIGVLAWFFGIVRNNIGYSVALAIYAPFTFYFITQPMNPGAMWTVGKVRKAYISAAEAIGSIPLFGALTNEDDGIEKLTVENGPGAKHDPRTPYEKVKPKYDGFLISTDVPSVEKQGWSERMSNFKQVQIAYESSLQLSQRMGRLEQMENQLNFPLIAESSYRELDVALMRLGDLRNALEGRGMITPEITTYLENETLRARQFKLYIWDKMVRYMLDHPYIVMDEAKEHSYVDYYVGRNFIFLEEITKDLAKEYQGFRKPEGFEAIEKLSKFYQQKKVNAPTVEARLEKNHFLHKMKGGFYNSTEMREHLKRQWEILFLSYNRTQEASNFGLQMYVWSVRNSVWALGSLMSAKNREFELLVRELERGDKTGATGMKFSEKYASERGKIEDLYESLFHILSLEYVSIRDELNGKLEKDLESTQRQAIIEALQTSFKERTAFMKSLK